MLQIQNVLFARDFSGCSERALPYALAIARRLHATLHVVFVEVPHGRLPEDHPAAHPETLQARLAQVGDLVEGRTINPGGLRIVPAVVRGEEAASALLDYVAAEDIDLVVLGTHGHRGVRHLILGSVAEEVVRRAPCPVLTVGPTGPAPESFAGLDALLVPVDFSRHAAEAVRYAKELAALFGARVDLLHVFDVRYDPGFVDVGLLSTQVLEPDREHDLRGRLMGVYEAAGGPPGPSVSTHVVSGAAAGEIAAYAKAAHPSLIVMATHGLTGLSHLLLGSVSERVVRSAPCPVFTVKSFGKSLIREAPAMGGADASDRTGGRAVGRAPAG